MADETIEAPAPAPVAAPVAPAPIAAPVLGVAPLADPGSEIHRGGPPPPDLGGQAVLGGFDVRANIPDEYKDHACLRDVPDFGTLVKNYVNAQEMIGKPFVAPGPEATPEEKAAYAAKLGVPRDLDGYKAAFDANDLPFDDVITQRLAEAARLRNITPEALIGIMDDYVEIKGEDIQTGPRGESQEVIDARSAKVLVELRSEWGGSFDRQLGLAMEVVKSYPGLGDSLAATGAGNDPAVIRAFAAIGAAMANEGLIDGSAVGASTREASLAEANNLMVTQAYLDSSDPAHKAVLAKVTSLFEAAYPNK